MASIREQITASRVTALGGPGKPAGLRVHRSRRKPIEQDKLPAMVVYQLGEETKRKGGDWGPLYEHELALAVEVRVKGDPPDQQLDPYVVWAQKTMVGDQTAGGLAKKVEFVGAQWQEAASNQPLGAARLDFIVTYLAKANDPEAQ
jgi:hypothetical protein